MINKEFQNFLKKNKLNKRNNFIIETNYDILKSTFETPDDFFESIMDFFDNSNLIFPAFTHLSVQNNDQFDLSSKTDLDIIHQIALESKFSFRTVHPTHSFTLFGKDKAKFGTKQVKERTPLGKKCPYALFTSGKILCFGSDLKDLSYVQYLEEINRVPFLFNSTSDRTYYINNKPIKYRTYIQENYDFQNEFYRIIPLLNLEPLYFNDIEIYIIDIKELKNEVTKKLKENPYYFVSKK